MAMPRTCTCWKDNRDERQYTCSGGRRSGSGQLRSRHNAPRPGVLADPPLTGTTRHRATPVVIGDFVSAEEPETEAGAANDATEAGAANDATEAMDNDFSTRLREEASSQAKTQGQAWSENKDEDADDAEPAP
jgi:hypothetical protein